MIVIYHKHNTTTGIVDLENGKAITVFEPANIARNLFELAALYPDRLLLWCNDDYKEQLNREQLPYLFHHKKLLLSYGSVKYIPDEIGYVDENLFVNPKRHTTFPTWQMNAEVGGIHAEILNALQNKIRDDKKFCYFLCSLAKLAMPLGLQCYSEPLLLKHFDKKENTKVTTASVYDLFRFVKQHYRGRWIFLLLINLFLYEKKIVLLPFINSLFYKKRSLPKDLLDNIPLHSDKTTEKPFQVDVIIPTIGRKAFLYDVLKDLSVQTVLPQKVIIVEQNPDKNSSTELQYLSEETWPFVTEHRFIHQTGACNARNIALPLVESEWVFFADDDIRFSNDFLQNAYHQIKKTGGKVFTISCLRQNDKPSYHNIFQWTTFGSGCSIVNREAFSAITFDIRFENGFGEDTDFGMQLRNKGYDVLYLPQPEILHLKAPVGGFRTKPVLDWQTEKIQPKPSPTVMLYKLLHHTKQQINGYKTTLFIKFYKHQPDKNPLRYYRKFQKTWKQSVYWANVLKERQ